MSGTYQQNYDWIKSMYPYALRAYQSTGVFVSVILAQWAHETGFGTSDVAQNANNLGGIKFYDGAPGQYGPYAAYGSIDQFVDGYSRVLNLPYLEHVRGAATPEDAIRAFNVENRGLKYAEDTSYSQKVLGIFNTYGLRGYDSWGGGGSAPATSGGAALDNLSSDDLKKYAGIGLAAVALFALLK